ncbi:unnamed protein product [Blumeria hordei]|uniref:Uncharacterized protein n=1 Tax=Blumeria hordei TaxID=2867405 RepID=A0A383UWF4_BLUHO|nr:unnamed protein product [Blumeria hordei]
MQPIIKVNSLGSVAASLSRLDNGKRTHQIITSPAFKEIIGVEGRYSCFAPPPEDQPIRINADIPVVMREFLSGWCFWEERTSNRINKCWYGFKKIYTFSG